MSKAYSAVIMGILILAANCFGQQFAKVNDGQVDVSVKVDGAPPLPFQAVMLQWCISNTSQNRLGPLMPIDDCSGAHIKGPKDDDYRGLSRSVRITDKSMPIASTAREHNNRQSTLFLEPGEATSVSFAFCADWARRDGGWLVEGKAAFPRPGKYSLKCKYPADLDKDKWIDPATGRP